ncbi:hypothetical protein M427DRAFT_54926 [Gonapodya prolifera JEL478]|uniref:N-acetyltransferase domain-containing protein n=1 Tax=Gonapodya prolifera (strain JEL478) TaxID=1344416 RepID=A0A139AKF4_GONPJ|nr:hypothetical protein M427DRAFT_54926 [Gonapodya prolifera JEL478]|eukprot:KXS17272.1 hypothetical protein M427DRAFT_54926 [Gonapodya prolifera JEL478]
MQFSFTVAECHVDELSQLIAIEHEAGLLLRGCLSEDILSETMPLQTLQEAHAKDHLLVARLDDSADNQLLEARRPVGFAMIETLSPSDAHLSEIDVHPSSGRREIGTALVKRFMDWGHSHGFKATDVDHIPERPMELPILHQVGVPNHS